MMNTWALSALWVGFGLGRNAAGDLVQGLNGSF